MNVSAVKSLLFFAFFLSGCSGLIYQTVWVRMLARYLGATTHATATVLVVFMAGLALGAYLSGRVADRVRRPLLGYSLLELAIGALGLLASFAVIEGVGSFYVQVYDWVGRQDCPLSFGRPPSRATICAAWSCCSLVVDRIVVSGPMSGSNKNRHITTADTSLTA